MSDEDRDIEEPVENTKVVLGVLVALLVVGAIVVGGYLFSRNKSGKTVLPSGYEAPLAVTEIDCSQPRPANADKFDYYNKCDSIKLNPSAKLVPHENTQYGFKFNIPDDIELSAFANGVGINYKEMTPDVNLLYSFDLAETRSGELASVTGEDYVRNYWRQYPGLTGINSLETITNASGATGYKAVYVIGGSKNGEQEVFFELGENTGDFVHFTSGILEQPVFDTIIGSFEFTEPQAVEPTSAPPLPEEAEPTP